MGKRRALLGTAVLLVVGVCVAAVFLMTRTPMTASNAPTPYMDIPLADIPAGTPAFVTWNGAPYALVRTTAEMLDDLQAQTPHTWNLRPIPADRPAFFVYALTSPVRGCVVRHSPKGAYRYAPERLWQGGFYDPCHFAEWDYAGRAIKQYPDQDASMYVADLAVPAFELRDPNTLRIHH
jgi:ubiquinol-cytochrome c reductase iron-sulfur subunit